MVKTLCTSVSENGVLGFLDIYICIYDYTNSSTICIHIIIRTAFVIKENQYSVFYLL